MSDVVAAELLEHLDKNVGTYPRALVLFRTHRHAAAVGVVAAVDVAAGGNRAGLKQRNAA